MGNPKTIVISLGGSIICPQPGEINVNFLKKFKKLILKYLRKNFRFIIVPGGGKICRVYQKAAAKIIKLPAEDIDWLGIHTTRLNAHLLRTIFRKEAYPEVLDDPHKPIKNNWTPTQPPPNKEKSSLPSRHPILIGSGWRPGRSTDYIVVLLARRFKIKEVINAGDVPFVYDKDPDKYKSAKAFKKISWSEYRKLVGWRWSPGLSAPFDPVAAGIAKKLKIRVCIIKGTELPNFERVLAGKKFKGTIIGP